MCVTVSPHVRLSLRILGFADREKSKAGLLDLPFFNPGTSEWRSQMHNYKKSEDSLGAQQVFFLDCICRELSVAKPLSGLTCSAAERTVLQQSLYQDLHAKTSSQRLLTRSGSLVQDGADASVDYSEPVSCASLLLKAACIADVLLEKAFLTAFAASVAALNLASSVCAS